MIARFQGLFIGGEHAHGVWDKETGDMRTEKSPASTQDYEDHLGGIKGLGLVPIRQDSTCRFAAIDIDHDTIDHLELYKKVTKRKMPLTVCRSKSGGAHLYLFIREPGISATKVIQDLKKWSALLGYPKAEIFPKQAKISGKNLGNWINLPYFNGDNTTRYAVGPTGDGAIGALSLEQFLDGITWWNGTDDVDATMSSELIQIGEMPPCLVTLTQDGLPEGSRNSGLFNFAVFYKKSSPNGWEEKVVQHNLLYLKPALSNREVQSIIKSVNQRTYQYTCAQEPICSRCVKQVCLTLKYGVGYEPWKDADNFDDLLVSHVRKVLTDPPRYIVEVNGHDIELSTKEFLKFPAFKDRIFELIDLVLAPQTQGKWEQNIKELMQKKIDISAPEDASTKGQIISKLVDFLGLTERTSDIQDILKGYPVIKDNFVWFRINDVQRYFQNQKFNISNPQILFQILHLNGGNYQSLNVRGKIITAWRVPIKMLNLQTEDFDPPTFSDMREEI